MTYFNNIQLFGNVSKFFSFFSFTEKCCSVWCCTTTGGNTNGNEALNFSYGSNISHISHISSILPKDVINTVITEGDDPVIKSMIDEEFKNLEHEEKEEEKCQLEIKRGEAKEKAIILRKKRKN